MIELQKVIGSGQIVIIHYTMMFSFFLITQESGKKYD